MRIEDTQASALPAASTQRHRGGEYKVAQQERDRRRRLQELQAENYREGVKIDIPAVFLKGGAKLGKTVNSRRVLASKKTLANVWDDDPSNTSMYIALASRPSAYPMKPRCSECGFWSDIKCQNCRSTVCSLRCLNVHHQRCER